MKAKTWKMEGSDPPLVANVAWAMNGQWTASSDFSARDARSIQIYQPATKPIEGHRSPIPEPTELAE